MRSVRKGQGKGAHSASGRRLKGSPAAPPSGVRAAESEERYRILVETTGTGYVILDMEGKVLDANHEYVRLSGHSSLKQILGRSVVEWTAPYDKRNNAKAVRKCIADGKIRNFEVDYEAPAGRITPIEINASVLKLGGESRILTLCRDISERRKAVDALKAEKEKASLYLDVANTIFVVIDNRRKVLLINRKGCELLGRASHEIVGRDWFRNFIPAAVRRKVEKTFNQLVKGKLVPFEYFENPVLTRDGRERLIAWHNTVIRDEKGAIKATLSSGEDVTERRQAEKILREREECYRSTLSSMIDLVFVLDREGRFVDFHAPNPDMLLLPPKAFLGKTYAEVLPPVLSSSFASAISAIRKGRNVQSLEYEMDIRGKKTYWSANVSARRDTAGGYDGATVVARDITGRKHMENKLLESEGRLSKIIEQSPIAMAIVGMDENIEYINRKAVEVFGYQHVEIPDMASWWRLAYPDKKYRDEVISTWMGLVGKAIKEGREIEGREYNVTCKDRTVKTCFIFGVPVAEKVFVMFQDVTDRRRAEEALRSREEFIRNIADNLTSGMIYQLVRGSDGTRRFTYLSGAVERFYGISPEQGMADSGKIYARIHPDDRERVAREEEEALSKMSVFRSNVRMLNPDGSVRFSCFVSNPHSLPDGSTCWDGIEFDVTEQVRMQERILHSEKMEAVGQLAGGIAHDFNNQLVGIMGCAEMLLDRLDDENLRKDTESILRSAKRASDLTRNLLAFSRKGNFLTVPVNVHKAVEEVIEILAHSIDKRISISRSLKASPATIIGDPTQLQNAILNLAINAKDAIGGAGEIAFATDNVSMEDVFEGEERDTAAKGRYVRISVADNGCGIDSETMKRIFEPFFTTKGPGKGTGMGLPSVYGMVKSHGGAVKVESSPGKGSKFSLSFPVYEAGLDESRPEPLPDEKRAKLRILLVEDEEIPRNLIARMLRSMGHKVDACRDGLEAVEHYRKSWRSTDMIVLDLVMPRMSGRDAFAEFVVINPEARVLVVSGFSQEGDAQYILDAGGKAFLQKPFTIRELAAKIQETME